ncbi:uncharacterized protein LOC132611140 [Lycium barbarum]|uniref:uncharacterized protein LOC132611140 n=1 Tax=Lycium barbarum TaxID=112863 RepID=UPI00293E7EEA|nr:uncharacterized protein LOC132611140 [Lycium barbarum]
MRWFKDGDRNIKFFNNYVKGRRRKLAVHTIQNSQGDWLNRNADIGQEAVSFYQHQFRQEATSGDYNMLKKIPKVITKAQNEVLTALPSNEKVKNAVFGLNGDSTGVSDGFSGHFFQTCWSIVGGDVTNMENINTFADLRPISLSTFANKIISRVLHERIVPLLPAIISSTQTGFIKGRSIMENVLRAQEIIRDINKRNKLHNVVVKLDMTKAYDRVSYMVWRLVSNNWYLILINGKAHGFFNSSRGLKQGDPLSPTLFIIAAEVLARNLNELHDDPAFKGYGMPKWIPHLNHLSHADDTILFCSADPVSLRKMMKVLRNYEKVSGQLVNNEKSSFYLHEKVPTSVVGRVKRKTGMRLLSFGGRYILIAHVLQTMPFYLLSAMIPLKGVIEQLHKIFANFFWSNTTGVKGKHWVAWEKMCLPNEEGGLAFRSLHDISKAVFAKLWLNFRTTVSLWGLSWLTRALFFVDTEHNLEDETKVKEYILNGEWDQHKLTSVLSSETVEYIVENISPALVEADNDKPWWMGENSGQFFVKSAWEEVRQKQETRSVYKFIWLKGMPIKISFFLWRLWKRIITTDDNLKRMHISLVSRCWCCEEYKQETMSHLFLTSPTAFKLWKQFVSCAAPASHKLQTIFQAILAILLWEIWKRRNSIKHGRNTTYSRMVYQVQQAIYQLVQAKYPWIRRLPPDWPSIVEMLTQYKPRLHVHKVVWELPQHGFKCNTDEAFQRNPGLSSYAFCIRDDRGDLMYAQAKKLGTATNMEAETAAIQEAIHYCYSNNLQHVLVEIDSLALKNIIQDVWKIPWKLVERVEMMQHRMRHLNMDIKHVFRKGNQLADFLANTALQHDELLEFHCFQDLPSMGRKIINMDKSQIPSLRIRTRKIQHA